MNHTLYIISTFLHIVTAIFWTGSMLFMTLVLVPSLRAENSPGLIARMLAVVGTRYKRYGWAALVVLVITGWLNLHARGVSNAMLVNRDFWEGTFGTTLAWKLMFFVAVIVLSILHDGFIGPRFRRFSSPDHQDKVKAEKFRFLASWMGRLTLLLSLVITALAVMMVRGVLW